MRVRILGGVRFLRRSDNADTGAETTTVTDPETADDPRPRTHTTPGKGRATPKRRDAEAGGRRRGPAPPPPRTQREASKLARQNRPTKEARREAAADRRRRMDAGDDRVLLPRDRGPVRAYIRDVVDSRPHIIGLFLPLALLFVVVSLVPSFARQSAVFQQYVSLFAMLMLAVMLAEGVYLGITITRKVREKFPDDTSNGVGIGWYAFSRATQLRRMRVPKPKVERGANV